MTIISGIPNLANTVLCSTMTTPDVALEVQKASIHLEWASMRIRNILALKNRDVDETKVVLAISVALVLSLEVKIEFPGIPCKYELTSQWMSQSQATTHTFSPMFHLDCQGVLHATLAVWHLFWWNNNSKPPQIEEILGNECMTQFPQYLVMKGSFWLEKVILGSTSCPWRRDTA